MARENRASTETLKPEQRLAALVVGRLALAPPVDLRVVADGVADIEIDSIPGQCDGLVVGLLRPKPLVIIDKRPSRARRRFTLAHELGHVLIPWHIGNTFLCDPDRTVLEDRLSWAAGYYAAASEPEANRFAGELLVPSAWLEARIGDHGIDRILPLVAGVRATAVVSTHVACLRLTAALPAGFVFAIVEFPNRVVLSGQTSGTGIDPPRRGESLERQRLDQFATEVEEERDGSRRLIWWRFRERATDKGVADTDPRGTKQVLDDLLMRTCGGRAAEVESQVAFCGVAQDRR